MASRIPLEGAGNMQDFDTAAGTRIPQKLVMQACALRRYLSASSPRWSLC